MILKEANKQAEHDKSLPEKLRHVANTLVNCTEMSAQEAVYHCLSMKLSVMSRDCVFINNGPPNERYQMIKSKKELEKMDQNSTDIVSKGLLDYYISRPKTPKIIKDICLAQFASIYTKTFDKKVEKNIEVEDRNSTNISDISINYPNLIKLENKLGYMKKRKFQKIIRYKKYNKEKDPENYYRSIVMLYYPWFNETEILKNYEIIYKNNKTLILLNMKIFDPQNIENILDDAIQENEDINFEEIDNENENIAPEYVLLANKSPNQNIFENDENNY
jgi:hypothetical protein